MKTTKAQLRLELIERLENLGFSFDEIQKLRRIEMTLQRWGEKECGDGSDWAIERDETTQKPFMVYHGEGKSRRYPTPDKETGALKRLGKIMQNHSGLLAYHQGDCRGCNLYILRKEDIREGESVDSIYSRGFSVCD